MDFSVACPCWCAVFVRRRWSALLRFRGARGENVFTTKNELTVEVTMKAVIRVAAIIQENRSGERFGITS